MISGRKSVTLFNLSVSHIVPNDRRGETGKDSPFAGEMTFKGNIVQFCPILLIWPLC